MRKGAILGQEEKEKKWPQKERMREDDMKVRSYGRQTGSRRHAGRMEKTGWGWG